MDQGSTAEEVLAVEPVVRRVIAARVREPADRDDLVHDCLERVLMARHRLAPETLLPFSIVTAQNLVRSHARSGVRRARIASRLREQSDIDTPEDAVLADEARQAMQTALLQLTEDERNELLTHGERNQWTADRPAASGALRVRVSRTRAKLRLEYLLAFRDVVLPTPRCKRVLLSVSAGDIRAQRSLHAGEHLINCETCAALYEPLAKRNRALTAIALPLVVAGSILRTARAHPWAATAGAGVAAAATIVGLQLSTHKPLAAATTTTTAVRAATTMTTSIRSTSTNPIPTSRFRLAPSTTLGPVSALTVNGSSLFEKDLRDRVGQTVRARGVTVEQVVTHDGFWVGPNSHKRIWVELVGPFRIMHITVGEKLDFVGTIVRNEPRYATRIGLESRTGSELLTREGAHVTVSTTEIHPNQ